jgi:hypothetical protein
MSEKAHDIKSSYSEDEEKGYDRKPVKLAGFKLFAFAFSTLGIIYSDIGEAVLRLNLPMAPPILPSPSDPLDIPSHSPRSPTLSIGN